MKRFFKVFSFLAYIAVLIVFSTIYWFNIQTERPADFETTKIILIEPGSSGLAIANKLQAEQIITQPKLFYALLRLNHARIKAGEYEIPPHTSLRDALDILSDGKIVQRQFTLAEGLTVKQAIILLQQNSYLSGDITIQPDEGTLLPETYSFTRNDTRDSLIKRMQDAHQNMLDELWEKRDADVPLASKQDAVTLASIVEKETGKPSERPRIAGLFFNRLKINMPLQTDPTVVYAITDSLGHMGGKRLYSKDIDIDSPYNTYKKSGLPPGPIANPGKASLEAVLHPEKHDYLYFVADGTGGHVFGKTLDEHEKNVSAWRKIKKQLQNE